MDATEAQADVDPSGADHGELCATGIRGAGRLSAFHAFTYGLKFGLNMEPRFHQSGPELSLRVEYYQQTMDDPRTALPDLQGLDLYPALKAVLVQVGFSY